MSGCYSMSRRVLFHETDLAGVMHFSNYYRIMEEIEHAWWRSPGLSVHMPEREGGIGWPRVSATCDFTAPVRFEDELDLVLRVAEVGSKSLTLAVEFRCGGKQVASGSMRSVCCKLENDGFRAVEIPAAIRGKLLAAQVASAETDG